MHVKWFWYDVQYRNKFFFDAYDYKYQGIVGCTPTNVPLWEIPIKALYSGILWVIIPKHNKYHGYTQLSIENMIICRMFMDMIYSNPQRKAAIVATGPFLQCLSCPSATYAYSSGSTATCRFELYRWLNWSFPMMFFPFFAMDFGVFWQGFFETKRTIQNRDKHQLNKRHVTLKPTVCSGLRGPSKLRFRPFVKKNSAFLLLRFRYLFRDCFQKQVAEIGKCLLRILYIQYIFCSFVKSTCEL